MRVQTTQTDDDGNPHPKSIRLPGMDGVAEFGDDLVAEVSDRDGRILIDETDFVKEIGEGEEPDPSAAEPVEMPTAEADDEPADTTDVDSVAPRDGGDDAAVTADPAEAEAERRTENGTGVDHDLTGDGQDDHDALETDTDDAPHTPDDDPLDEPHDE